MSVADPPVATRHELLRLLGEAAELEHSLICQYLFAAFSLKREGDPGATPEQLITYGDWARTILMVARQEMEHLGLVCNLLAAVGGAPTFGHHRFPYTTDLFGHQMALEPFGRDTIRKFVCFERPEHIDPSTAYCVAPAPTRTVGDLYARIRALLVALDGPNLFIGAGFGEINGMEIGTDFPRVGGLGGGYDVFLRTISDMPSALGAVDLIIEQGEGTKSIDDGSHFRRFSQILEQLEARPDAEPARPVGPNPRLVAYPGATHVTHPTSRAVMELFDAAYRTMLLVLIQLWGSTDETNPQRSVLEQIAFMPLMTVAVRPLAEILMTMPAHQGHDSVHAGPAFDTGGPVVFLPHRTAAWRVLGEQFDALSMHAARVAALPDAPARLPYLAQTVSLMARKFNVEMKVT